MQVIVALVGGLDGGPCGHVRGVPAKKDARGGEVGLHGIRQTVHPQLFGAHVDVGIIFLCGGRYLMKIKV